MVEIISRIIAALPGIVACAVGCYAIYVAITARSIRWGISKHNTAVRAQPLAVGLRAFIVVGGVYSVLGGTKYAIEHIIGPSALGRTLVFIDKLPIRRTASLAVSIIFATVAVDGIVIASRRLASRGERAFGLAILVIFGSIATIIVLYS